ncbi:Protein of unknown function DUF1295 like protein [Aduncisulcus paluster]|uniref:Uncharacterized protein n=1 Tax=Aduncisulcus paluster TaxID=2918883 RepID=A0ABQ5JYH5_9EUKA|nr:Protein of unknown function DUF1295 like protein [Aduncisulcus paluster]
MEPDKRRFSIQHIRPGNVKEIPLTRDYQDSKITQIDDSSRKKLMITNDYTSPRKPIISLDESLSPDFLKQSYGDSGSLSESLLPDFIKVPKEDPNPKQIEKLVYVNAELVSEVPQPLVTLNKDISYSNIIYKEVLYKVLIEWYFTQRQCHFRHKALKKIDSIKKATISEAKGLYSKISTEYSRDFRELKRFMVDPINLPLVHSLSTHLKAYSQTQTEDIVRSLYLFGHYPPHPSSGSDSSSLLLRDETKYQDLIESIRIGAQNFIQKVRSLGTFPKDSREYREVEQEVLRFSEILVQIQKTTIPDKSSLFLDFVSSLLKFSEDFKTLVSLKQRVSHRIKAIKEEEDKDYEQTLRIRELKMKIQRLQVLKRTKKDLQRVDAYSFRQWTILIVVFYWGLRLTINWARWWPGFSVQDWRYDDLKSKTGKLYWIVSFFGIHMFPTVLVFLGCLPLWPAMLSPSSFSIWDILGIVITVGATTIEWIADEQLKRFQKRKKLGLNNDQDKIGLSFANGRVLKFITTEISFWFGIYCFGVAGLSGDGNVSSNYFNGFVLFMLLGPIGMVLLFTLYSIPVNEKRNVSKREFYSEYVEKVSMLIPWKPLKGGSSEVIISEPDGSADYGSGV